MRGKHLVLILLSLVIFSNYVFALSLSPSELKIKNTQFNKNYQFILLVTSEENGLRNIELKSSSPVVSINPNKFLLEENEKKSVRLSLRFPQNIENKEGIITIQPFINNLASEEDLKIIYSINPSEMLNEKSNVEVKDSFFKNKEAYVVIIYGLIITVSVLIVLFILPDIKRTTTKINQKFFQQIKDFSPDNSELKGIKINSKESKRLKKLEKKLNMTDKRLKKMITTIESFIEKSNGWLNSNSGGKYGLE